VRRLALVSRPDLERALDRLARESPDVRAGLFGPDSIFWRVNRNTSAFLGAGRAMLLQLAHPWVARAIADHSNTTQDPLGRFRRTFVRVFDMAFGDLDSALRAARLVHTRHERVTGALPGSDASVYAANESRALSWVHATLWDTSLRVYERLCGPLSRAELDRYYAETLRFALLFGVESEDLPPDWGSFQGWVEGEFERLEILPEGRQIARFMLQAPRPALRPVFRVYRAITAEQLPPRLRFLPAYLAAERRIAGLEGSDPVGDWLAALLVGRRSAR